MGNSVSSAVSDNPNESLGQPTRDSAAGGARLGAAASAGTIGLDSAADPATPKQPADNGHDEIEQARRLRTQYAEISQLAGGLAHEVRNPLSTLSLNLDLLAEDFQSPETPRERRAMQRIERLRHEVDRLHGIVESFLRFARVQDLKLVPTDLNAIVDELRDFYEPQAASRGIVIRTQFAQDLPPVGLDADLFKQALLNLALNAQHAMPEGGELILTTRRSAAWAILDVIDTGVGMSEAVRARIFDPFFSTRKGGSGLGLPTTRKIVEAHGGTIQVRSDPGKGSQFSIQLPLCEGQPKDDRDVLDDGFPPSPPSPQA
jgi:signal transduction histidine kinase